MNPFENSNPIPAEELFSGWMGSNPRNSPGMFGKDPFLEEDQRRNGDFETIFNIIMQHVPEASVSLLTGEPPSAFTAQEQQSPISSLQYILMMLRAEQERQTPKDIDMMQQRQHPRIPIPQYLKAR